MKHRETGELHPYIHNYYLTTIKKMLGASFVGWVQDRNGKYLKITVKGNTTNLPFQGGEIIGEESYRKLINDILKSFGYGGEEIQEPVRLSEQQ